MNHLLFHDKPKVAILIKDSYFNRKDIEQYYVKPLGFPCMAFSLYYEPTNKVSATKAKECLKRILPSIKQQGITYLYVADSTYFKQLTKEKKSEINLGYVLPCKLTGYEHLHVIYGINYAQLMYNQSMASNLTLSLNTLANHVNGKANGFGDIIHEASYNNPNDLIGYLDEPMLAIDIETTGLELGSELISIAFAKSEHSGISFKVSDKRFIKQFFEKYHGYKTFHNASFDIKHIIYHCFMDNPSDMKGLLHGLHTMCRNLHDTKIIAYLATNNTQGNTLGLKDLSHEFVGNYAVDVTDVTKLTDDDLLEYNLKDTLATFYVFNKYYPIMLQDNQENIYNTIMLPSLKTIIQMELTGMPMDMAEVLMLRDELRAKSLTLETKIQAHELVKATVIGLKEQACIKYNQSHKKQKVPNDFKIRFNPNSPKHMIELLYTVMMLPVIDYTDTKQPSVSGKTITKLMNHTDDTELLGLIREYIDIQKILSTFIPAFLNTKPRDNHHWLHGNFNLGGTVSGRLSSSNPNLQNLPSGSTFGKPVKKCFTAPKGWIFCGADYNALEDKVNTLLTKDPNKEKIWIDGYDGHCYRAFYYWRDQFPDIKETVESINSIKDKYPKLRQRSKAPSFALQYSGTKFTLMNNCGFSEQEAQQVEKGYHEMYKVSDEWVANKIKQAEQQGYLDTAFGLKIRTPVLAKSILGNSKTPYLAIAEARSVGNAVSGQSYGMLTNRALNEFMERVWKSEYSLDIFPVATIHDAIYLVIKDNINVVKWVNDNLAECMSWQELPELQHDKIKLTAELGLFYPNWANEITLPNKASRKQIKEIVISHK